MKIEHMDNGSTGEFFVNNEIGEKVAELSYFYETPKRLNANHTFVDPSLRGQGVADALYQALVSFVQKETLELIPSCSYIASKWQYSKNKNN